MVHYITALRVIYVIKGKYLKNFRQIFLLVSDYAVQIQFVFLGSDCDPNTLVLQRAQKLLLAEIN